jgi:hypothetical protein
MRVIEGDEPIGIEKTIGSGARFEGGHEPFAKHAVSSLPTLDDTARADQVGGPLVRPEHDVARSMTRRPTRRNRPGEERVSYAERFSAPLGAGTAGLEAMEREPMHSNVRTEAPRDADGHLAFERQPIADEALLERVVLAILEPQSSAVK